MRLLLLLLLVSNCLLGQKETTTKKIEASTENYAKYHNLKAPTDIELNHLIDLCVQYRFRNEDTTRLLGKSALELTKNKPLLHARALVEVGYAYGMFGAYDEGVQLIQASKVIYEKIGTIENIAYANTQLGYLALNKGNLEIALEHFLKVIELNEQLPKNKQLVSPYLNVSWLHFNMNELGKMQQYIQKAETIAEALNDDAARSTVAEKKAIIFMYTGEMYMNKAQQDSIHRQVYQDTSDTFINQSFEQFEKSIVLAKKQGDLEGQLSALNNMVVLNLKIGRLEDGEKAAKQAEILSEKLGDIELVTQCKYNLIYVYMELKEYKSAEKYGEEGLFLAKRHGLKRKKALLDAALYELYNTTGQYKNALYHLEERFSYEKEIGDAERSKALAEVEAQFQNVRKEKEIVELREANAAIARQRNLIIGGILLMGLFGFSLFQFNKVKKERNDKIEFAEALIFAQEEERRRIARDLHDGVGQSLLLLKKQLLTNHSSTLDNQKMITETLEEVRSISRDLHPLQLEKFGLTAAIEAVIHKVENSTDLFITTEIENIDKSFADKTNIHLFRAVQEALNNVVKHAAATAARVTIKTENKETIITILDNGKGFDHELAVIQSKSLGLKTMYERLISIGGKMKIIKNEPSGTKIEFRIPVGKIGK